MSAVSSTFGTHYPVHAEECAIPLSLKMCRSNQGSLVISFRSGISVRPMHLFGRTTAIMITSADSPGKGSGTPNQLLGVQRHTEGELCRFRIDVVAFVGFHVRLHILRRYQPHLMTDRE